MPLWWHTAIVKFQILEPFLEFLIRCSWPFLALWWHCHCSLTGTTLSERDATATMSWFLQHSTPQLTIGSKLNQTKTLCHMRHQFWTNYCSGQVLEPVRTNRHLFEQVAAAEPALAQRGTWKCTREPTTWWVLGQEFHSAVWQLLTIAINVFQVEIDQSKYNDTPCHSREK